MLCRSFATSAALKSPTLAVVSATSPQSLSKDTMTICIGHASHALADTESSESFISHKHALKLGLHIYPASGKVSMATSSLCSHMQGYCIVQITMKNRSYSNVRLSVLPDLCSDVILGHDFLK